MMSVELRLVCGMLAVWRVTHLLSAEDGPGDVVVRLRALLGQSMIGRAMDCFYCLSIWVAAPLAFWVSADPLEIVLAWLALSGGACLLERATTRGFVHHTTTRATREGEPDELLWTAAPGTAIDDGTPSASEPRAGREAGARSDRLSR